LSIPEFPDRIIRLEMAVAHLEHELGQMHSVLLLLQADLKASREQVSKLERRVIQASESHDERDPMDERPPHY
jgi:SlyX protein